MTSVKRRRDRVDILGFDVAGKLSDDIVQNTAMASNTVMAYPTLSPLSAGSNNTKTFRMDIKHIGRIRLSTKNMSCLFSFRQKYHTLYVNHKYKWQYKQNNSRASECLFIKYFPQDIKIISIKALLGVYYAVKSALAYSTIISTQIHNGINQLIIISKLLNLDIPILNIVIVSE